MLCDQHYLHHDVIQDLLRLIFPPMFLAKDILLLLGFLPFLRWALFLIIISAFMMVEDFIRRNRRVTMATVTVARSIVVPALKGGAKCAHNSLHILQIM